MVPPVFVVLSEMSLTAPECFCIVSNKLFLGISCRGKSSTCGFGQGQICILMCVSSSQVERKLSRRLNRKFLSTPSSEMFIEGSKEIICVILVECCKVTYVLLEHADVPGVMAGGAFMLIGRTDVH